mgnify:CR=1 FL=1
MEELIGREPLPAPKFWLNPEIQDFYAFTADDVKLTDYETHEQIRIRDYMDEFPRLHTAYLRKHMHQHRILAYIPVIRGQDVLGTLVQNPVRSGEPL